jgi:Mg2+/citrate symporter
MNRRDNIQMLIPETHRDLIEAVPRGFPRSAVTAALLMGAMAGSLWTYIVPQWLAVTLLTVLFAVYLLYKRRNDKFFDERLAALETRGLRWETSEES